MICKDVRSGTGLLGSMMRQLIAVVLLSTLGDADLTGEYLAPAGCVAPNCDYTAKWSLDSSTDVISFTITAKQPTGTWTGIAFGPTTNMEDQDTIYGYVDAAGASHVVDAKVGARFTRPVTDSIQNLMSPTIAYADGTYTMTFKRKRDTADTGGDVIFTDQPTLYVKYPVGGGPMQGSTPMKHTSTPVVSPTMICVCAAPTSPMAPMSSSMAPSSLGAGSTTVMGPSPPSPPPSPPPSGPSPPPSPPPSGPSMPPSGPSPSGPSPPPSPPPSGPSPPPSPPPSGPSMPPSGPPPSGPSMPPSGPPPSGPSPPPSPPPSGPSQPPSPPPSGPSPSPSQPPSGPGLTSPMPTGTATLGSSSRTRTATIVAAVVAFAVLASIVALFACCFLV